MLLLVDNLAGSSFFYGLLIFQRMHGHTHVPILDDLRCSWSHWKPQLSELNLAADEVITNPWSHPAPEPIIPTTQTPLASSTASVSSLCELCSNSNQFCSAATFVPCLHFIVLLVRVSQRCGFSAPHCWSIFHFSNNLILSCFVCHQLCLGSWWSILIVNVHAQLKSKLQWIWRGCDLTFLVFKSKISQRLKNFQAA